MTLVFCSHLALWWVKKETLHFVLSFGKIALSKLLQNVESPFRGAAPLKAHIAPQDPVNCRVICIRGPIHKKNKCFEKCIEMCFEKCFEKCFEHSRK